MMPVLVTFTGKDTAPTDTQAETYTPPLMTTATSPVISFPAIVLLYMFLISIFIAFLCCAIQCTLFLSHKMK